MTDNLEASAGTKDVQSISSIQSIVLEEPPSCIEFSQSTPSLFVVGTYLLESEDGRENSKQDSTSDQPAASGVQSRSGSLILFRWENEILSQMQTTSVGSAVLDLHFSHLEKDVLAVATSVGLIRIYHLQTLNAPPALQLMQDLQVFPTSVLILSLAWHPFKPSRLATSLSTGEVAILDYGQSLRPLWTFRAHSLEAWTVAWSYSQQMNTDSLVFSGGDDSTLYAYELETLPQQEMLERSGPDKQRTNLIRRDVKIHGAGVTAILPLHDQYVVTGSYDEFVRLLEPVENRRWKVVAETRLGGGVWRIKLLTYQQFAAHTSSTWNILVSCMHAGTRLLAIGYCVDNGWSINILAKFEEHQSMNYASDATTLEDHKDSDLNKRITTVVSTSFYDRKLCIWELALSHQMTVAGNMQIAHK